MKEERKWKCDICGANFDNFHAQGFDGKIHCPLCYFKHEYNELKAENEKLKQYKIEYSSDDCVIKFNDIPYVPQTQLSNKEAIIKDLQVMAYGKDITITTCPKCGEKYSINYCREVADLRAIIKEAREYCNHLLKQEAGWGVSEEVNNVCNKFLVILDKHDTDTM